MNMLYRVLLVIAICGQLSFIMSQQTELKRQGELADFMLAGWAICLEIEEDNHQTTKR